MTITLLAVLAIASWVIPALAVAGLASWYVEHRWPYRWAKPFNMDRGPL